MNINNITKLNITNIGDPFVLKDGDNYYMYATSFIDGFYCWTSKDMKNWSLPIQVYKKDDRSFGYKDFWAPEVVEHNGKFIMHYSARCQKDDILYIGVAVSDSPTGRFIDVYDKEPMFNYGYAAIDGHVLKDGNDFYFYYDKDCSTNRYENRNESHIYVVKLDSTLTKITSNPILVSLPTQEWETVTGDFRWNEGAFVVKKDYYYLMYSSGYFASPTYSIGYAVSDSPLGPFVKSDDNPILYSLPNIISGPGHNSVVQDNNGDYYCFFHAHTDMDNPSENRQAYFCKLEISNKKITVI